MSQSKLSMLQVEARINSMFSVAKLYKSDSNSLRVVYNSLKVILNSRTPSGKRRYSVCLGTYAFGYYMALSNQLRQNELEFCYVYDSELYSTHKNSSHKNAELLFLNRENSSAFMDRLERGHFWKNTSIKFE